MGNDNVKIKDAQKFLINEKIIILKIDLKDFPKKKVIDGIEFSYYDRNGIPQVLKPEQRFTADGIIYIKPPEEVQNFIKEKSDFMIKFNDELEFKKQISELRDFIKNYKFFGEKNPTPINIFVYGAVHAGKSSFINLLNQLLNKTFRIKDHVNNNVSRGNSGFRKIPLDEGKIINFITSPGIEVHANSDPNDDINKFYSKYEKDFHTIVNCAKFSYDEIFPQDLMDVDEIINLDQDIDNQIHAVIIVLDAHRYVKEDDRDYELQKLKTNIQNIVKSLENKVKGIIFPIFVLMKLDKYYQHFNYPSKVYENFPYQNQLYADLLTKIENSFTPNCLFGLWKDRQIEIKSDQRDIIALQILKEALKRGKERKDFLLK